ncbi:MAG: primosomal protein N', partial [Aquificaceae bacterium]|nr:primosomal protein N' [Aquificaceae bacterium]
MYLKLALSNGRILKVKADFPYKDSPIGYRVLLRGEKGGTTALVVGLAKEGQEAELSFPDESPLTTEKHLKALLDVADYY